MSDTAELSCSVRDAVATLTLANPSKYNALTSSMLRAVPPILGRLADDDAVGVLVLTGAGGSFCSGADISALDDINAIEDNLVVDAENAIASFPKPTIAAIRGYCVGGGCQVAAACDIRIASSDARFGVTPAKIGVVYPASSTARLVSVVGPAAAKMLLFSGDLVDASVALRMGLVGEVVSDPAGLDERVAALSATLVSRSQLSVRAAKDIIDALVAGTLSESRVRAWQEESHRGEVAEGVAAFLERRAPVFPWPYAVAAPAPAPAAHRAS